MPRKETTSLDDMVALARAMQEADAEVEALTEQLKAASERARQLREETIPSAMQELELTELKLSTGQRLTIKQDVYASIPSAKRDAAYAWLDKHGFGGLIKVEVAAAFGRGEANAAVKLQQELIKRKLNVDLSQSVNAQTLKAFLREQIAAGTRIPLDLFGARPVWVAKLK